jgi:hypothetical protein
VKIFRGDLAFGFRPSAGQPEFRTHAQPAYMAKNFHGSIFAEEIALRVHLLELFNGTLQRRCRAMVFAVSRIDGLIGTLERGPDLLAPLDAYLFRIIETHESVERRQFHTCQVKIGR